MSNYTKQDFKVGEILKAAKLNAMDEQIAELSNIINNSGSNTCEDCLTVDSLKTINGQSLVGSGDIVISGEGGTGTVGPQGPQGEQGPKGEAGTDGVSITSVEQTTTSSADGGTNVVTVTLSNGTTSTFNVKNGSKGSTGSKGATGATGATGANGVTFTPSVDSEGNLSWTNNGGLTNPSTVNIKGPKGDAGEGSEDSSGGPTVEYIDYQGFINIEDNKVYVFTVPITELSINVENELPIGSILRFRTEFEGCMITMPDSVRWANNVLPNITGSGYYELSLATIDFSTILAVITTF